MWKSLKIPHISVKTMLYRSFLTHFCYIIIYYFQKSNSFFSKNYIFCNKKIQAFHNADTRLDIGNRKPVLYFIKLYKSSRCNPRL